MNPFIFTISVNSAKVTAVMLVSFQKHHPGKCIHIIGTPKEIEEIDQYSNCSLNFDYISFIDISKNAELMQDFKQGHRGTAKVMAMVIKKMIMPLLMPSSPCYHHGYTHFIHLDSDLYFKRESISIIESAFIGKNALNITCDNLPRIGGNAVEGVLIECARPSAQLVGTRRCYGNNPSGIKGLEKYPDTISTYIFGMDIRSVPDYPFEKLCRYCEGAEHPLGWPVLDFFDGVTHAVMQNGGHVHMLDQNQFGSQNTEGKKTNNYASNMHMDCGSHLIHFGGVGSGHAFYHGHSKPAEGYANWAVGRYALFCKLFYNEDIPCPTLTQYGPDGRWINGTYDDNILETVKRDVIN